MIKCVYMPRFNIYIRKQDLEAWDKIQNKSQWIHIKLLESGTPQKIILNDMKVSRICPKGHFYKGERCTVKGCDAV